MGFRLTPQFLKEASTLQIAKNLKNISFQFPGINPSRFKPLLNTRQIVKSGILPNEKLTFGQLRRRYLAARHLANMPSKKFDPQRMWNKKTMLQLNKAKSGAADWYKSKDWRRRAMKYGGLTGEEASATSKYLSDNIRRAVIAPRKLIEGGTRGATFYDTIQFKTPGGENRVTIPIQSVIAVNRDGIRNGVSLNHEAHHAAMLSKGLVNYIDLGITDKNVINGMAKLRANADRLAKIMDQNLTEIGKAAKNDPKSDYKYYNRARELRSRIASMVSQGRKKLKYFTIGDMVKPYIDPQAYKKIVRETFGFAPIVGGGLYAASQLNDNNEEETY